MLNNRHHSTPVPEKRETKEGSPRRPKIFAQRRLLDLAKIRADVSTACGLHMLRRERVTLGCLRFLDYVQQRAEEEEAMQRKSSRNLHRDSLSLAEHEAVVGDTP